MPGTRTPPADGAPAPAPGGRLLSLDALRGLIMVLLMLESTRLYDRLLEHGPGWLTPLVTQFVHHPWHGLRFWDLIQPGFMFIAGTALALSLRRQEEQGVSWSRSLVKQLRRSGWLFFWGVLDYAVRDHRLSFELWDVLTQLSFTSLVAFSIARWSWSRQLAVSVALLALAEGLYRFAGVAGFDQPFTDQKNFGNYVDWLLMRKINPDGWVAINCLSTAAHTIWGVVAGQLLLDRRPGSDQLRRLVGAGILALAAGFILDQTTTPIIKRIATSSFVLASGGFVLLGLAAAYWWIDLQHHSRHLEFLTVVGKNSLFIYLFFEIVGSRWFTGYVTDIVVGLTALVGATLAAGQIAGSLAVFALEWKMLQFLDRRGVYFKI